MKFLLFKSLFVLAIFCSSGICQEQNRITVFGESTVSAETDQVTIVVNLDGSGPTVAAAIAVFKERKQKFVNTMNPMDFPDVKLEYLGQSVSQSLNFNEIGWEVPLQPGAAAAPARAPETAFKISEQVEIEMTYEKGKFEAFMESGGKLLDKLDSEGIRIGPSNFQGQIGNAILTPGISNEDAIERQAYTEALANARTKAETLAELAGVELGPIVGIAEKPSASSSVFNPTFGFTPFPTSGAGSGAGSSIRTLKVKKELAVEFSIK